MIVRVFEAGEPRLEQASDFRAFKLVASSQRAMARFAAPEGPVEAGASGQAFVQQDWIVSEAGLGKSEDWLTGFRKMVAFAEGQGWVRDFDGAIRAHIEYEDKQASPAGP